MSTLSSTPGRRSRISKVPRASLSIWIDVEEHAAIPPAELAEIARHVQDAVDLIARSLHDLEKLSPRTAVGIQSGSVTLKIEAPNDTEQFAFEFIEADTGVQAIQLFVEAIDMYSRGDESPARIGDPARKSLWGFIAAVRKYEHICVEAKVGGNKTRAAFLPRLVVERAKDVPDTLPATETVEIVGRLYGVNLETHSYRIKDGFGRTRFVSLGEDLDDRSLARTLLGETIQVTGMPVDIGDAGADHYEAISIEHVAPATASEYYTWNLATALESIEPIGSIDDLRIPGLTDDEADEFWHAVND